MRKQVMFLAVIFIMGCMTSLILVVCILAVRTSSVDTALRSVAASRDPYAVVFGSSGTAWILLTLVWLRIWRSSSRGIFILVVFVNSAVIGPVGQAMSAAFHAFADGADFDPDVFNPMTYWMGAGDDGLLIALNIGRGLALTGMIRAMRNSRGRAADAGSTNPHPVVMHDGPEQVTRILCGYAILGDAAFRHGIVDFFRNRWVAAVPEYGLDIQLLCSVCEFTIHRHRIYGLRYFAVLVASLVVGYFSPGYASALLVLAGAGVCLVKIEGDHTLSRAFRRSAFNTTAMAAKYAPWQSDVIRRGLPPSDQNVVVYKGFSPFVGAGIDLDGWSIVTRIDKPDREHGGSGTITSFGESEIYSALEAGLREMELKNFDSKDVLFIRGIDVREDLALLDDVAYPPVACLPDAAFDRYFQDNKGTIRGYKRIQFRGWGGDLVITMFARFSIEGRNLVLEVRKFLLAPLSNNLRLVDRPEAVSMRTFVARVVSSAVVGPFHAVFSPFAVLEALNAGFGAAFGSEERLAKARRKHIEENPFFDHGAHTTLRESYAQTHFAHYFQKTDFDSVSKLIERRILNVVEDFLERHGIDASDFRERQASILNAGIIVQGGDIRAESLAVGHGAKANKVENNRQVAVKEGA